MIVLKKVRDGGGAVSVRIAMAGARAILMIWDRTKLVEFGGHVQLNGYWAYVCAIKAHEIGPKKGNHCQKQICSNGFCNAEEVIP